MSVLYTLVFVIGIHQVLSATCSSKPCEDFKATCDRACGDIPDYTLDPTCHWNGKCVYDATKTPKCQNAANAIGITQCFCYDWDPLSNACKQDTACDGTQAACSKCRPCEDDKTMPLRKAGSESECYLDCDLHCVFDYVDNKGVESASYCETCKNDIGKACISNDDCPWCLQCCPEKKKCETPPAAKSMLFQPDINDNDFVEPNVDEKKGFYEYPIFGYISYVGFIAFILINNVFIVYWCCFKRRSNKNKYEKCDDMIVVNEE